MIVNETQKIKINWVGFASWSRYKDK